MTDAIEKCRACGYAGSMQIVYGLDEREGYVAMYADVEGRFVKLSLHVCPACGDVRAASNKGECHE